MKAFLMYQLNNHLIIKTADLCSLSLKESHHKDQDCNLADIFMVFHVSWSLFERAVYQWQSWNHGFRQPGFHTWESNSINLKVGPTCQDQQHITRCFIRSTETQVPVINGHWYSVGAVCVTAAVASHVVLEERTQNDDGWYEWEFIYRVAEWHKRAMKREQLLEKT